MATNDYQTRLILLSFLICLAGATPASALDVRCETCSWDNVVEARDKVEDAGGGTIYIPEGTCDWSGKGTIYLNTAQSNGKGNINVIGAGIDRTIIKKGRDSYFVFYHNGRNTEPIRISGMTFDDCKNIIKIRDAKHWRVDHIKFLRVNRAVMSSRSVPGLVDNCEFIDGSLIDSGMSHSWSKKDTGFGFEGNCLPWPDRNFGTGDAIFIEDNKFIRFRQPTAGYDGAHYVFRYNTVYGAYGDALDMHGPYGWGDCNNSGRTEEVYHNKFIRRQADVDAGYSMRIAVSARGGAGIVFSNYGEGVNGVTLILENTYKDNDGCGTCGPGEKKYQQPHDWWIWNNNWTGAGTDSIDVTTWGGCSLAVAQSCIKENEDFFLREPTEAFDGFTYIPFEYPHPLRSGDPDDDNTPQSPKNLRIEPSSDS